jgi:hypothetical protein
MDRISPHRRGRRYFHLQTFPDWPWGPPSLYSNGYRGSFPGVIRPELDVHHSPLSSANIDTVSTYICAPLQSPYGIYATFLSFHVFISSTHATFPAHLVTLIIVTLIMFCEKRGLKTTNVLSVHFYIILPLRPLCFQISLAVGILYF